MPTELQQLVSESRDLVATARHLLDQNRDLSRKYRASNVDLCARSREAIAHSIARLTRHRDGE